MATSQMLRIGFIEGPAACHTVCDPGDAYGHKAGQKERRGSLCDGFVPVEV